MKLNNRVPEWLAVSACIALILLNPFSLDAKTNRASLTTKAELQPASTNSAILNLSDFESVGDGVADDGPALQRALDALAEAGGGTLLIPAGLYLIKTPVIRDFGGASVIIQGVPSDTMPAPPTAGGNDLAESLDLASEFIPQTGATASAIKLLNINDLTVEHLAFTGIESSISDAYITLFLSDIKHATVRHSEFYGIATFGTVAGLGGGNIIRAVRSELSVESSVFLGCAANSGAYAPIIDNLEWKRFSISNSIFVDYGLRSYYGKMGLGAPLSWINLAGVAPRTPDSPRREAVVRDTFLDEGGWIGITAFPHLWGTPADPIDLIYISGLKMNVSNLGTAGHQFFDVRHVLIENSHYGWSHNTGAALDFYRTDHAILNRLTCVLEADRIRADVRTERLTVINSQFGEVDSLAQTTTILDTEPDEDPVQFVRQQFLSILGREPDPAEHYYWSDLLIRCGSNQECLEAQHTQMEEYLENKPEKEFAFAGIVIDENGNPLRGVLINLTGSSSAAGYTDAQGKFSFSGLPTAGSYTVTASNKHHTFTTPTSQTVERPLHDVSVTFRARLNRHSIVGRITKADGSGAGGATVTLGESPATTATTDADGNYSFADLAAGENYTVIPSSGNFVFFPAKATIVELSGNTRADFALRLTPELLRVESSEDALVFDAVTFKTQPLSIFDLLGYGKDGINRLVIFARNLEGVNDRSQFSVVAEDDTGQSYPLELEFMADVPHLGWLKQLNVKLSPQLSGKCVRLRLASGQITSNTARICLAAH